MQLLASKGCEKDGRNEKTLTEVKQPHTTRDIWPAGKILVSFFLSLQPLKAPLGAIFFPLFWGKKVKIASKGEKTTKADKRLKNTLYKMPRTKQDYTPAGIDV